MAKSAMEALNRRFEEESGDTNVDIEVIVNADGEAAEDIIEATDAGEQAAEDVAISQENEEATQEASDMAELATVLRKHGLTPGMAAVLKITVPLAAYGITLPAMESLDSSGRNQAVADRIANRLDAAVESFWSKTKEYIIRLLNRIMQAFQWIWHRAGSIEKRVKRAHASIENRKWNDDLAKGRKFKEIKESKCTDALGRLAKSIDTTSDQIGTWLDLIIEDATASQRQRIEDFTKKVYTWFSEQDLKDGLGYKLNESGTGLVKDSTVQPEVNEVDADSKHLEYCKTTGFDNAMEICRYMEDCKENGVAYKRDINKYSKRNKENETPDKGISDAIKNARDVLSVFSSIVSKWSAVASKFCMVYVKQCSMIRLCTTGETTD